MADFDCIRFEGNHEKTIVTIRVPEYVWNHPKPEGHKVEIIKVVRVREVAENHS